MKDNWDLIIESVSNDNVLPLISECNLSCEFCSNYHNSKEINAAKITPLSIEDVKEVLCFLDPGRKIIIGESATKILEGEPFLHPDLMEILALLRSNFPGTLIQLTTNGTLVTYDNLKTLKKLEPIEFNFSINMLNYELREKILGDGPPFLAVGLPYKCSELEIDYNGSIVVLPSVDNKMTEVYNTLSELEKYGAKTARLLIPGYTNFLQVDFSSEDIASPRKFYKELLKVRKEFKLPILIEPSILDNLDSIVAGVIKGSQAQKEGIKAWDEILKVDHEEVFSRVDAYNLINAKSYPKVLVKSPGLEELRSIQLKKEKEKSFGLCFDYDISKETVENLIKIASKGKYSLILTSRGGYRIIKEAVKKVDLPKNIEFDIKKVENNYFGGNIISAGLLLVDDFRLFLKKFNKDDNLKFHYDQIILPAKAFDTRGLDLRGEHYKELEYELGTLVNLCN